MEVVELMLGEVIAVEDPFDRPAEVLTGVFYVNPTAPTFIDMLNMTDD